jgi:glycosyltransferase involved in cell wall biosynthesis
MRIAIACHQSEHSGGVETYIETILPGLAKRGHELGVWYETGRSLRFADSSVSRWFAHRHPDRSFEALTAWKPDAIFAQGLRSPQMESRLLSIAPAVLYAHSYIGTCVSGAKMHAFPGTTQCSRRFGVACLALYHPRRCGGINPVTALQLYRNQSSKNRMLSRYRGIAVASAHMQREYARHGFDDKVRVLPLPVSAPAGFPGHARADTLRLLFAGRIETTKGPDLALDAAVIAAARLGRPVLLTIAGRGALAGGLEIKGRQAEEANPNLRVRLPGWMRHEQHGGLFAETDLLLVPSRWPEPFGLIGLEAAAAGVPAIAFDVGGIPDWLTDGVNGRLLAASSLNAAAMADAIVSVATAPGEIERMGQAARAVAARFTLDRHLGLLEEALAAAVR